ncbi:MAG: M16 family metallopeptidase [Gemmatimonadaceae bacterium]
MSAVGALAARISPLVVSVSLVGVLAAPALFTAVLGAQAAPLARARAVNAATTSAASAADADSGTTMYTVSGIRVIHRRAANDVVAANLYLLGGVRQVTAATAGIEPFLLQVSELGTKGYPKERLRRVMAGLGTTIVVGPSADWTMIGVRATTATFDSTWAVLADRVMRPVLEPADVEQVRAQYMSALAQRRDSPEALVNHLADSIAFVGHPYALDPVGSERSIGTLQAGDLRDYLKSQMVRSRMLLVVVGNVSRPTLERLVSTTLGTLPAGDYAWEPPPPLPSNGSAFVVAPRVLPTNYVLGYFAGPPATSPDYSALRVATAVLSGRMFHEIRVKRNLTYAVSAPFVERAISAGGLYVTTVATDTTLALMRTAVAELQLGTITDEGLDVLIQQFLTEYFLDNETNADQADFLARAQLYQGDWKAATRFADELRTVTPQDVRRVANVYIKNVRFAYVGDARRVPEKWFRSF